jgi:iron complex transport system ATP-binding protein
MVLHDVNEAAKVSHRIVAMQDGRIIREGTPGEIVESSLLAELYGVTCDVYPHPESGQPFCVPRSADAAATKMPMPASSGFDISNLRTGYGRTIILRDLCLNLPAGAVTAIVGPNACGKSTLLRTCARLLQPQAGGVRLGERQVHRGSHRVLARELALLAQGPIPPAGFLVEDLVAAGRTPHQSFWHQWRDADELAVEGALARCDLCSLRYREVATLSGGQRQRAWVGMALAQDTPVLLLDEPTTFLDIAAQIDLLDLVRVLNREEGRTVVMILHDLNLAARYADYLVAMKDGEVVATGTPGEVINHDLLRDVFSIEASIITDPRTGAPLVLPVGTRSAIPPVTIPDTELATALA